MKSLAFKILVIAVFLSSNVFAQSQLVKNLRKGKHQVLVVYGTSLTAGDGGRAWVDSVGTGLNKKYGGNLTVLNTAKSAMWSGWGVQNLEDSVISKKPDAVMIEFGINDAFLNYKTSPALARLNLIYMIDRIKLYNPACEVILQVMDIPINVHAEARPNLTAYYEMYRQVAVDRRLLLIDHYPHWQRILDQGKDLYLKYVPDGIHPSPESAKSIIAPYVLKRLEEGD
ncbi:MAG: GDSL-like Lipase/Acylhydrolase family protein [Mucilaginibacter sp.]|nr:GDSL-like Lipase/Acylhydrolase family protein [Mucilaginibacter sp.]